MQKKMSRTLAAVMALGIAALSLPATASAEQVGEVTTIYATDFEDGDVSAFSKRGDTDTSVIGTAEDADAPSGTTVMSITERSNGWNGPQFSVSDNCEPGVKYTASVWVKTAWYNSCMLSMQYTDEAGEQHYSNLATAVSEGGWVQIPEVSFSYSEDMKDVYIYVECSDKVDLFVDDFAVKTAPVYAIEEDIPGLKDVFADYFKIGGAVTASELAPNSTKDLILKHYNSITLGNELKPENMLDQAGCQALAAEGKNGEVAVALNGQARSILNFCRDNDIAVRGHVLVWHSQTPGWFFKEDYTTQGEWVDKDTMLSRMESYIKGVMAVLAEEYSDVNFYAWDVVNEAWLDDGTPRKGGMYDENANNSGWTQVFGDNSFIPYAFEYARKYAPEGCKLYYNDFNEYMPQKVEAIVNMATELKEQGLIDGIGMQSHLDVRTGSDAFPSVNVYNSALDKYAALGLDIQVTELDATIPKDSGDQYFVAQAEYYKGIMDSIIAHKDSISAVVFWGTTDDQSWRTTQSPLLFNADYTAKPAYYAIIACIDYDAPTFPPVEEDTTEATEEATTEAPEEDTTDAPEEDTTEATEQPTETVGPASVKLGDTDLNGTVTLSDVVAVNRFLLNIGTLSDAAAANADVDLNTAVTPMDALYILQYVIKLIPDFSSLLIPDFSSL